MQRFFSSEPGNTIAEYGLILALVCVFCIAALSMLGGSVEMNFNFVSSQITGVQSNGKVPGGPGSVAGGGKVPSSLGGANGSGGAIPGTGSAMPISGKGPVIGIGSDNSALDGPATLVAGSDGQNNVVAKPPSLGIGGKPPAKPGGDTNGVGFADEELPGDDGTDIVIQSPDSMPGADTGSPPNPGPN